jgi:hypothetical protein
VQRWRNPPPAEGSAFVSWNATHVKERFSPDTNWLHLFMYQRWQQLVRNTIRNLPWQPSGNSVNFVFPAARTQIVDGIELCFENGDVRTIYLYNQCIRVQSGQVNTSRLRAIPYLTVSDVETGSRYIIRTVPGTSGRAGITTVSYASGLSLVRIRGGQQRIHKWDPKGTVVGPVYVIIPIDDTARIEQLRVLLRRRVESNRIFRTFITVFTKD